MIVTHQINIDLQVPVIAPTVTVVQLDSNTRVIKASLYSGNVPFILDGDAEISLACIKPDRTKCWYDQLPDGSAAISVDGNIVSVTLAPEALTVAGIVKAALVIRDGLANQISTFPFVICVAPNPAAGSVISNTYYKIANLESFNKWIEVVVCCTEQELNAERQAQARKNIDAMQNGVADTSLDMRENTIFNVGFIELIGIGGSVGSVLLETETRESGTVALQHHSGGGDIPTILGSVADGEADSDAATVRQLRAVAEKIPSLVSDEKYFNIDADGLVSLKPEYRGLGNANYAYSISDNGVGVDGSCINDLPEDLVIPDIVNEIAVTALASGMFCGNSQVKSLTIPSFITDIPKAFCFQALSLESVYGTENVTVLNTFAFNQTPIKRALFPKLVAFAGGAHFANCVYLTVADIGGVTALSKNCFNSCERLSCIRGGTGITELPLKSLYYTHRLKNLPFAAQLTSIGDQALYNSRVNYDWLSHEGTYGAMATYAQWNTEDWWTGCSFTPCITPLKSTFNQLDPNFDTTGLTETEAAYVNNCQCNAGAALYSIFEDKEITSPVEFVDAVKAIDSSLMENNPATDEGIASWLEAFGYTVEIVQGYNAENLQKIYDALAAGNLVLGGVIGSEADTLGYAVHAVLFHGVTENGEIMVADSASYSTFFGKYTSATYAKPIQNMAPPTGTFLIVQKQ